MGTVCNCGIVVVSRLGVSFDDWWLHKGACSKYSEIILTIQTIRMRRSAECDHWNIGGLYLSLSEMMT